MVSSFGAPASCNGMRGGGQGCKSCTPDDDGFAEPGWLYFGVILQHQYFTGGVFQLPDKLRLSTPSSGRFTGTLITMLPINALSVTFNMLPRTGIPPKIPSSYGNERV